MAVVKIQSVTNLSGVVNYSLQEKKTNKELVTSYECDEKTIKEDFQYIQNQYNRIKNVDKDIHARMIIQSFDNRDSLTPEQVHKFGVELAERYLKGEHQYLVVTHIDSDNLHNHIIFNSVKNDCQSKFLSTRKHTVNELRKVNDIIAVRNKLLIPEVKKNKGIKYQEYYVRANNKSYKGKLENVIDEVIMKANNYEDFLKKMELKGYEIKEGKYISFKHSSAQRFTRAKSLGVDYHESSLKYRIENKDFEPIKTNYINKNWIDKTDEKFKNNYYLKRWASKQNIQYLSEISNKLYKEDVTLNDIKTIQKINFDVVEKFTKDIEKIDNEISKLEKNSNCFQVYKDSYNLIADYKKSDNKEQFKKENYADFKQYDIAKKSIYFLKKDYGIEKETDLMYHIDSLKNTRNELYSTLGRSKEREVQRAKEEQIKRAKEKEQDKNR